jgi:hypothetical protein
MEANDAAEAYVPVIIGCATSHEKRAVMLAS